MGERESTIFGASVYALPETTESRPRDGVFTYMALPWERWQRWLDVLQDQPAHLCSRTCPAHGDIDVR